MGTNPKMKLILFCMALAFVAAVDAAPSKNGVFKEVTPLGKIQANLAKLPDLTADLALMEKRLGVLETKEATFKGAVDELTKAMSVKGYSGGKPAPAPVPAGGR